MKKLLVLLLMCCIGCGENKEKQDLQEEKPAPDSVKTAETKAPEKAFLCFFASENENPSRNLRDSIILNIEVTGEVVTGNFDWIPAEKDSRRGFIQGTKTGDEINGNYAYTQEGVQDTVSVKIQLEGASARITTLSESGEEMSMAVERVDCL